MYYLFNSYNIHKYLLYKIQASHESFDYLGLWLALLICLLIVQFYTSNTFNTEQCCCQLIHIYIGRHMHSKDD